MEIILTVLIIAASFTAFAILSYFLIKTMFPRIENDDWEERYVQMKKDTERFKRLRSRSYNQKYVN